MARWVEVHQSAQPQSEQIKAFFSWQLGQSFPGPNGSWTFGTTDDFEFVPTNPFLLGKTFSATARIASAMSPSHSMDLDTTTNFQARQRPLTPVPSVNTKHAGLEPFVKVYGERGNL